MIESKKLRDIFIFAVIAISCIIIAIWIGRYLDRLGTWLPTAVCSLIFVGPLVLRWVQKRVAMKATAFPHQARVKWRKLDIGTNTRPFSNWIGTYSGIFRVTTDGIYCDSIIIPRSEVKRAVIYSPSDHPCGSGFLSVLRITTQDAIYDFSISPYNLEKMEMPFEVENAEDEIIPRIYRRTIPILLFIVVLVILAVRFLWRT